MEPRVIPPIGTPFPAEEIAEKNAWRAAGGWFTREEYAAMTDGTNKLRIEIAEIPIIKMHERLAAI